MTKEQWKPVVGYEEYYEISNIGRVRRRQTGRILKPRISNGYFLVDLRVRGKRKYHRVHRLVAYSFIGIQPTLKHEVRHFDGNKQNNNSNNLSWGTREDNEFDKIRHNKTNRGIRKLLLQGDLLQRQIAEMFNVTRMTISDIKGERSWAK
jgi:hypothetical protein